MAVARPKVQHTSLRFAHLILAPHLRKIAANLRDAQALDAFVLAGATAVLAARLILCASRAWSRRLTSGRLL